MSKVLIARDFFSPRLTCAVIVTFIYFDLLLLPEVLPGFGMTHFYFFYELSIPGTLLLLTLFGSWGALGLLRTPRTQVKQLKAARRRIAFGALGLLSFALVFTAEQTLTGSLPPGSLLMDFNQEAWIQETAQDAADGDISERQKMLGDLVKNVLPGKTREEILGLLGPPLKTEYFRSWKPGLIYHLGMERNFFSIDSEWLLIWFDKKGMYERDSVVND